MYIVGRYGAKLRAARARFAAGIIELQRGYMKAVSSIAAAVLLVLAVGTSARAVDFRTAGWWWMAFDYAYGGSFMKKDRDGRNLAGSRQQGVHAPMDNFESWQRLMFKLDAAVSENLQGTLMLEAGDQFWGHGPTGGALGTDGVVVEVKNAYVDWNLPGTDLRLRMGLQGLALPGFSFESNVLIDDVAAVVASYRFSNTVEATAFWARPYNDNFTGINGRGTPGFMDNMDLFALVLPLHFTDVNITPWAMAAGMGPNVLALSRNPLPTAPPDSVITNPAVVNTQAPQEWGQFTSGMLPAAFSARNEKFNNAYAFAWWAGLTGEVKSFAPWRIAWDANYGGLSGNREYLDRSGWIANLLIEYVTDWGIPGIYGWYSSGDDGDVHNGSERMPFISQVNVGGDTVSTFGFRASPWVNNEGILGGNTVGFRGVGARIRDVSFLDGLRHTIRLNLFGGTNDPKMASYIMGRRATDGGRTVFRSRTDFNSNYGVYLTRADTGLEFNLDSQYKIYENLTMLVEAGYIHLWLNEGAWGRRGGDVGNTLNYQDAFKVSVGFQYAF